MHTAMQVQLTLALAGAGPPLTVQFRGRCFLVGEGGTGGQKGGSIDVSLLACFRAVDGSACACCSRSACSSRAKSSAACRSRAAMGSVGPTRRLVGAAES